MPCCNEAIAESTKPEPESPNPGSTHSIVKSCPVSEDEKELTLTQASSVLSLMAPPVIEASEENTPVVGLDPASELCLSFVKLDENVLPSIAT